MNRVALTALCLLMFSAGAYSQIVDKTEEKVKDKSERRVDQKIDDGIDKGLDAIEGLFSKKKKKDKEQEVDETAASNEESQESSSASAMDESRNNALMSMMGGGEVDVPDAFHFDHRILLHIENYSGKGNLESDEYVTMFLQEDGQNFGMQVENDGVAQYIIYNIQEGQMLTLINSEGQKMGMSMNLNEEMLASMKESSEAEADTETSQAADIRFRKTGNSKEISGFQCDEYIVEGEDMEPHEKTTVWMTTETDTDWMKALMKMSQTNKKLLPNQEYPDGYPEGAMIQTIIEDTKSDEKSVTTVDKAELNGDFEISTEGYRFMNMGNVGQ